VRRALAALLLLALVACGDDDSASVTVARSSPATTTAAPGAPSSGSGSAATSAGADNSAASIASGDTAGDQQAATASLLQLSDFPSGWSEDPVVGKTEEEESANRQIAHCAGVESTSIIDFGGAIARSGTFTSSSQDRVADVVSVAPSPDAASQRLAVIDSADVASCMNEVYTSVLEDTLGEQNLTLGELKVARLNVGPAGDETVAYRITVPVESKGTPAGELYVDLVAVRVGRGVSGLNFQAQYSPFRSDDTDRYIGIAANRMKEQGL
jgi:hypothetical protein